MPSRSLQGLCQAEMDADGASGIPSVEAGWLRMSQLPPTECCRYKWLPVHHLRPHSSLLALARTGVGPRCIRALNVALLTGEATTLGAPLPRQVRHFGHTVEPILGWDPKRLHGLAMHWIEERGRRVPAGVPCGSQVGARVLGYGGDEPRCPGETRRARASSVTRSPNGTPCREDQRKIWVRPLSE